MENSDFFEVALFQEQLKVLEKFKQRKITIIQSNTCEFENINLARFLNIAIFCQSCDISKTVESIGKI